MPTETFFQFFILTLYFVAAINPNYSMYFFDESKTASASLKFPFKLNSTQFTVAMWIQYPTFDLHGTFFTMFSIP